jgi:hypothetical protein
MLGGANNGGGVSGSGDDNGGGEHARRSLSCAVVRGGSGTASSDNAGSKRGHAWRTSSSTSTSTSSLPTPEGLLPWFREYISSMATCPSYMVVKTDLIARFGQAEFDAYKDRIKVVLMELDQQPRPLASESFGSSGGGGMIDNIRSDQADNIRSDQADNIRSDQAAKVHSRVAPPGSPLRHQTARAAFGGGSGGEAAPRGGRRAASGSAAPFPSLAPMSTSLPPRPRSVSSPAAGGLSGGQSRRFWKRSETSSDVQATCSSCGTRFARLINRKQTCGSCGAAVCKGCTVPVRSQTTGKAQRVCAHCAAGVDNASTA